MLKYVLGFVDSLIPAHVRADPDLHIKGRMMVESCLLVMPLMVFYFVFYWGLGYYWGSAFSAFGFVMAVFDLWDFSRRGNFSFSGNGFTFVTFIIVAAFTLTTYGLNTLIAPWIIMVPISAFLLVGIRSGVFWSILSFLLVVGLFVIDSLDVPIPAFVPRESLIYVNFASLLGLIGYIVITLLNNDLGKQRVLNDLRKVKADVEQKNAQITAINQALESTIEERTAGLLAANDELDTFLYESSHALRRPLVRIMGLLSLLKSDINEAEHAEFMRLIDYTATNMDVMLHDLLIVSEVYQHTLVHEPVQVEHEIHRIIEGLTKKETEFVVEVAPELNLQSDAMLVRTVLKKVIDNAVFYKREGVAHRVTVRAYREGESPIVEVEDNGLGIDAAALPFLFKMFVRGTEKSRGSGLGLFIVRKVMDRLEGDVVIESEKGSFTKVKMRF